MSNLAKAIASPTIAVMCGAFCTANPKDLKKYQKLKMAKTNILEIDYAQLKNFSSVVMFNTPPKKQRKTLPSAYSMERIISRRSSNNVS